jgi:hypothetical protein
VNTPGLLMNSLLAASRHDEFMRLVGWKGMAVCSRANLAWTMRLRSRPGIYGLARKRADKTRTCAPPHWAVQFPGGR